MLTWAPGHCGTTPQLPIPATDISLNCHPSITLFQYNGSPPTPPCHRSVKLPYLTLLTADRPCPSSLVPAYFLWPLPHCMVFISPSPLPDMPQLRLSLHLEHCLRLMNSYLSFSASGHSGSTRLYQLPWTQWIHQALSVTLPSTSPYKPIS